ncbi:Protein AIR2 [Tolypocladium paradoxum]|uniref:Protein AIR2 n=1 Tax=Tolypocladium paradoxum TaxID=94208 RepID=A0A2S4L9P0_9HYPO|nr:Protein AIR2 [Tolypocladium paradoxum]
MAAPEPVLGDMILIDSSEDETPVKGRKRPRGKDTGDAGNGSSAGGSRSSKRARLSAASQGSEEGEVGESDAQQNGSEPASATVNQSSRQAQGAVSTATADVLGHLSSSVTMPPNPHLWHMDSLTFKLPAFSAKREGSWHTRFQDWVRVFYLCNLEHSVLITPALTVLAFVRYLDNSSGLKAGKRKSARQTANQAKDSGALEELLEALRSSAANAKVVDWASLSQQTTCMANASQPTSTREMEANGTAAETRKQRVPTGDEERALQLKYFPSAADPSKVCLVCAREGHSSASCPYSACRFCGDDAHWSFCCPTKERCGKCLQFGHAAATCVEKLKLTKDDGLACAFCDSTDHLEAECTDVWRSFHPDADTIKTVVDLPVCCAICGARDHFLSDCAQLEYAPNPTWSLANRNRFIDPNCGVSGIEDVGDGRGNATSQRAPELKMHGHAARATNVHYSESDDSDVEFLANRLVKQPHQVGRIQMSSNIQMPGGNGGRNRSRQSQPSAQPPLPLGPPPPGPPRRQPSSGNNAASGQRGGSSSLPAKPPTPNRGYHSMPPPPSVSGSRPQDEIGNGNARGGRGGRGGRGARGGRGGRGGGGKGRGRGRGRAK